MAASDLYPMFYAAFVCPRHSHTLSGVSTSVVSLKRNVFQSVMESFAKDVRKGICRYEYNIDRIAAKYLKAASFSSAVICLETMKDFERKYTNNGFSGIRLKNDVVNFLPSTSVRRKGKVEKNESGKVRRIELTEQHRFVDSEAQNDGGLVRRETNLDRKLLIKRDCTPERPIPGSSKPFHMVVGAGRESIRSGAVDLSFFKSVTPAHQKQQLESKMLTLPSVDEKVKGMLALPAASKTIKKKAPAIKAKGCDKTGCVSGEISATALHANRDVRFIHWLDEAKLRTQKEDFDCDDHVENFWKIYSRHYSRVRRVSKLIGGRRR
ncbi:hypothetical protein Tcan_13175 [Toxocara canis]|uniref:Uncharacterized protein n=1 Tax=Toxocara canis TaxID=6265 RepID=A0A0B2VYG2_TOXCA|nr:hypothetical protein Tcan_13175 [Toxocara canis]